MATYPATKQAPETVRELIMALRKVANHNAQVFLDCGNDRQFIAEVQITDMMAPTMSMVTIVGGRLPRDEVEKIRRGEKEWEV